ncbi:MAG: DUF4384 domain-containing protein [Mariprofundales bacterium]|nr:DUF4384 domain-containing protein [Mariprofundales bacterium]
MIRFLITCLLLTLSIPAIAGQTFSAQSTSVQSTVVISDGTSCMGYDKSRKQTVHDALTEAKRMASEQAATHIKSQTLIKDAEVQSDLIYAFAKATVTIIKEMNKHWDTEPGMGECYFIRIQAEVKPEPKVMQKVSRVTTMDDPSKPLTVQLWTDKPRYHRGEHVHIYLRGNKPFYARLIYHDAAGQQIQLLPNPYRKNNYFQGGASYAIPATGKDRFDLEVSPPFGNEKITLYASTAPSGDLSLQQAGSVYQVTTTAKNIAVRTRGITLIAAPLQTGGKPAPVLNELSEFSEISVELRTEK